MKYNSFVINKETKTKTGIKHGKSEKWKNYAERITRNDFVRNYLFSKYHGICRYCGQPLNENWVIQHKLYDRECFTDRVVEVPHPTEKRPNRKAKVPDCERCPQFHKCVDDALFPVHSMCNMLIAKTHLEGE